MHYLDIVKHIKLHFSCSQAWCFYYSPASSSALTQPGHALMSAAHGIAVSGLWGSARLLGGAQQKEMNKHIFKQTLVVCLHVTVEWLKRDYGAGGRRDPLVLTT